MILRALVFAALLSSSGLAAGVVPTAAAAAPPFKTWIQGVRKDALRRGISAATLDRALAGLRPDPRVVALDRRQPELTWTFAKYRRLVVNKPRIATGRRMRRRHRTLLARVSARFGVPPAVIVALWGIETRYGARTGGFNVIRSLATLAYEGRRRRYFRKELMAALRIIDRGDITPARMTGSWAGAMGHIQFMPSSYAAYAVDLSGDGRKNIWGSRADIFASAANYLARNGWVAGERWGRRITLPRRFPRRFVNTRIRKKISRWKALGVRTSVSGSTMSAAIVQPDGPGTPAYFVYRNFKVIRRWNPSDYFALAVGMLADRVRVSRAARR